MQRTAYRAKPKLREARQAKGLSLRAFERQAGLSRSTIGHLERNRRLARPESAQVIADILGLPVLDLFEPVPVETGQAA